jgi:uncharacterized protein YebE (UPF0316 family)
MSLDMLQSTLAMAGMAVISVSLWTLRVALTARGRKIAGSLTAGAEAVVFLLAFSTVMTDLTAVEKVAGYAVGVAAGTLLGVIIDQRLSAGQSEIRVVSPGSDLGIVRQLHALGWPATWMQANGPRGEVTIAFVAVDDTRLSKVLRDLDRHAPEAFWTVERLQTARPVPLPEGCIQVRGGKSLRIRRVQRGSNPRPAAATGRPESRPCGGVPSEYSAPALDAELELATGAVQEG